MQSSHPGRRAARTATSALLAASIAGTIAASVLADTGRHEPAATTEPVAAPAQSASDEATAADAGYAPAPVLNSGSGTRVHAHSSAS